ncbi:DUF3021 domain-containing protein [Clostridium pasteurianum]|uniref:DUF3021 domain-containing protein n=1 Tax=Clostridium pasteurianum BC1 TaxID=86416 RepID=R4K5P4_CLOPA|nr:DUF3021 domain-containing protein [Clostridium pasteurianum]AGK98477.1 Protein of unknown function (DUF3021) [Clostridium pasteurianum BC1]
MTIKKAILRGLLGIPVGVFISTTIGLIISLIYGKLAVIPAANETVNPLSAYTIQYVVSIVIGFVFAFGSTIFEVDKWSIAKQTTIHFLLTSIVFLPCAVLAGWVDSDFLSIAIYFAIFIFIYIVIWISQYFAWKNKITKLNKELKNR